MANFNDPQLDIQNDLQVFMFLTQIIKDSLSGSNRLKIKYSREYASIRHETFSLAFSSEYRCKTEGKINSL